MSTTNDIINEVTSAPETFTSWEKCMDKTYCKWPAIIGIVIGSLIILSLLFCIVRCVCCGVKICTCCCGGCGGCGGSGRDRKSKHKDDYSRMPSTPYGGYQPPPAPAPMVYGYPTAAPVAVAAPPQFATFDSPSHKIHEDSLPPMPSWDTAVKRRVEDTSEPPQQYNGDLEMGRLEAQPARLRGGYNSVPTGPLSPVSPHPQNDYFTGPPGHNAAMNQSYHSDLGMQRMAPHGNEYDAFQSVPLSPPPTYHSESIAPSMNSDKFAAGTVSPSLAEYNRAPSPQYHQPSYAPSSISTRYEPSQQEYTPYNAQQQYQQRPPSFLLPGRKPVNGSFREV